MRTDEIKTLLEAHISEETNKLADLSERVEKILSNHLPHIQDSLTRLEERMKLVLWLFGVAGSVILTGLVGALLTLILR